MLLSGAASPSSSSSFSPREDEDEDGRRGGSEDQEASAGVAFGPFWLDSIASVGGEAAALLVGGLLSGWAEAEPAFLSSVLEPGWG